MPVPKWSIRIVGMDVIPSAVRNKSDIFQFVRFGAAQSDTVSKRGHEKKLEVADSEIFIRICAGFR